MGTGLTSSVAHISCMQDNEESKMLYLNPYFIGDWDYADNVEFTDNPYHKNSLFWHAWREGWLEAFNKQQMEGKYGQKKAPIIG